jgi:hypothetical protein
LRKILEKVLIQVQVFILYFFDFIFKINSEIKYSFIIGVDEIANCTYYLNKIFKKESISVNFARNKFYKSNSYDYSINVENKYLIYFIKLFYGPYLLAKLSNQADVFIYFWWTGFCIDREVDYKFLRKKNKKIVCIFVGSDIRSPKLTEEAFNKKGEDHFLRYTNITNINTENRVISVVKKAEKYANIIISPRKVQLSYLTNSIDNFMYTIDNKILNPNYKKIEDGTIKIVHAPSNPIVKGTPLVRAAIKKLQVEGYNFEYVELQNKSNIEVLEHLTDSHIVLNQFYASMPGVFGIEAMAKNNAVLMSGDYENLPTNGKKPWIRTKYWEVYDNLKYLLDNPEKIEEYANSGYEFIKDNYTEEKVREFYINTFYENEIIDDKIIFKK